MSMPIHLLLPFFICYESHVTISHTLRTGVKDIVNPVVLYACTFYVFLSFFQYIFKLESLYNVYGGIKFKLINHVTYFFCVFVHFHFCLCKFKLVLDKGSCG